MPFAIEARLCRIFRACEFFLVFLLDSFGTCWGQFLVVGPAKSDLTTHNMGAPGTQHDKLIIYSCMLQLQLTIMSDKFSPLTSHQKPESRCPDGMKQKQW